MTKSKNMHKSSLNMHNSIYLQKKNRNTCISNRKVRNIVSATLQPNLDKKGYFQLRYLYVKLK